MITNVRILHQFSTVLPVTFSVLNYEPKDVLFFDIETTGFSPVKNRIIEIGAVKVINGEITDRFSEFINPSVPIPFRITRKRKEHF